MPVLMAPTAFHRLAHPDAERATARAAAADLARAIGDPTVRIAAFDESQPGLRRFFSQLATYLGLVGLASLLVGGVGIASSVATFLRRQLATIAILKCLGAGSRVLLATYLIQTLTLALLGSLAGAALGLAAQPLMVRALAPFAPFALEERKWSHQQLGEWQPQGFFPTLRGAAEAWPDGPYGAMLTKIPPLEPADHRREQQIPAVYRQPGVEARLHRGEDCDTHQEDRSSAGAQPKCCGRPPSQRSRAEHHDPTEYEARPPDPEHLRQP